MPVRITLMVGARACPLEPNDARWLAAELPDAFGDVDADMRRGAPAVSKAIDVALEDGSDEELELGAFRRMRICRWDPTFAPRERKRMENGAPAAPGWPSRF